MKLVVFGSTGGTGRELVRRALDIGHQVTAFARTPARLGLTHPQLQVHQGDAFDPRAVAAAIAGREAVLCALGPPRGQPPGTIISAGVANILAGMRQHGVRRLVFESGLMVDGGRGLGPIGRVMLAAARRLNHALYLDKVLAERTVRESGLDWVIFRPPNLAVAPATGRYHVGEDLPVRLTRKVSHGDVADAMLQATSGDRWLHKAVELSY